MDGRLYFPSKEIFQSYYSEILEKDEEDIANILDSRFYKKGFYSLVPILNERTESLHGEKHIEQFKKQSISLNGRDTPTTEEILNHFDDLEEIVGEDVFESFLNSEAEIQVGNKIYKYTDQGLLIATAGFYEKIQVFMMQNGIHSLSDIANIQPLEGELAYNPNGGLVQIEEGLEHYIARGYNEPGFDPGEGGGSQGGGGNTEIGGEYPYNGGNQNGGNQNGGSNNGSGNDSNENYQQIADNLSVCSPNKPWFGNIFGDVRVCTDKYESGRRVKVKYYSVEFFLAYAIGIKVKHQKKGRIGFWRKQDADKVVLGVNSLSWKFDHSADFSDFGSPGDVAIRYYTSDNKLYSRLGHQNPIYVGPADYPIIPFENKVDVVIEVAVENLILQDEEQARQYFYSALWNGVKSFMQSEYNKNLKKIGVVIVTPYATWVQYYDFNSDCTNCSKKEKVIDWGVATPKVTYNFGTGIGGGSFSFGFEMDFKRPSLVGISAFGMAKRNGNWHGHRFVF